MPAPVMPTPPPEGRAVGEWCFVHAADLHLDTPFEGVGEVDEDVAARLRDASLAAFDGLVELALALDARFLVVAGDVYDGPERGLRAQLRFEAGVRRLAEAGIATFVAHGNHDPVATGWQLVTDWPAAVHVFGHEDVEVVDVVADDGDVLAVVAGVSYAERAETRNLARRFARTDVDALHVGVLHTNVGGNADHAPYAPCTLDDLRRARIDYWALGHVHQRTVLLDGSGGDPWAVYPGNLQGRSVRRTERGDKGATVVHVADGAVARVQHVTLDRARFTVVSATIDDDTTLGRLTTALVTAVEDRVEQVGDRVLVVRLEVTGRGTAHHALARAGARAELLATVRDLLRRHEHVVVTDVVDRSAATGDLVEPRLAALLGRVADDDVAADALATARQRGWTDDLPDVAAVAAAARTRARTLLARPR